MITFALAPVSSASSETNHVFLTRPGVVADAYVFPSVACYVLGFDSTTVPTDGTVSPTWVWAATANQANSLTYAGMPEARVGKGCVFCVSTTAPFTKTTPVSGTYFFSARVE